MHPIAYLFTRTTKPERRVPADLDEEYDWVFKSGPRAHERRNRAHAADDVERRAD